MNENQMSEQLASTDRLLSLANLTLTESNRKVIAWFFETPQVFEFNLDSEKAENIYKILKEAKEKELPVNVRSTFQNDKNIIIQIIPATEEQVKHFIKEKAQREDPTKISTPPHQ
jgi:transcriptional/translational regulatory protein YebC/TACO1